MGMHIGATIAFIQRLQTGCHHCFRLNESIGQGSSEAAAV
jgi:hypothetical protein